MPAHFLAKLLYLFTFTAFFLAATAQAEDTSEPHQPPVLLNAESYGVSDGLSQSTVTSIAEDDDGYIWIGTLNGLNRFDGKEFKHFFSNDGSGLKSSYITATFFDKKNNRLLIGTDNGLYEYNNYTDKFKELSIDDSIIGIDEQDDNLLITTNNGQYFFNAQSQHEINLLIEPKKIKKSILLNGEIYTLTHSKELYLNNSIIDNGITDFTRFGNEIFFVKNGDILSTKNSTSYIYKKGNVEHIFNDKDTLYGYNNKELFKFKNNKKETIGYIENNIDVSNLVIYEKVKNGIVLANLSDGFVYIRNSKNIIKTINENLDTIWALKSNNEEIVVSSQNKNINIYDKSYNLIYTYNTNDIGAKSAILAKENLYVGTKTGLDIINIKNDEKYHIIDSPVSAMSESQDYVFVGTANGIFYQINKLNGSITKKIVIDELNPIFDIYLSPEKENIYIASQGGLFLINNNKSLNIYNDDLVFCISEYKNEIYFGTKNKILKTSDGKLKTIYTNNLPIFSLNIDNEDGLIVASSIEKIIILHGKHNPIILDRNYGSQFEYNTQGIIKKQDDYFIGGSEGISYFNIEEVKNTILNSVKIKTLISDLLIFNIPQPVDNKILEAAISKTKNITLKYSDYPFTLVFNSPSTDIKKDKLEYKYRMHGLSDTWISSKGTNSATYTNLSPGEYIFSVYAINPITLENGTINNLKIRITPPWWLSIIAKSAYIIIASLLTLAFIKVLLRRREIQHQIALSEERLKLSLWGSGDEMWDWDIEAGKIYRSNIWGSLEFPRDGQRSGKAGEESNIHPQDQERVKEALHHHFYGETDHFEATYRVRSKTGEWLWILDRAKIVERDDKDRPLRMTGTIKNISSFKTAEEQLRLFERAIENISEGVFILNTEFIFVELNDAACDITRHSKKNILGDVLNFNRYSDEYNNQIKQLLKQQGKWNTEIEAIRGDGSMFLMELTIDAIYDEQGLLTHYVGVFSDISQRKQQEEELRRLTNNDLLTGLPNRSSLQVTLENLVKKDHHHTLMILDLDNFKKINDSLGHQVGDDLLCQVSTRLLNIIPKHTNLYRLGGDEFAILVDQNPDIGSSALIANDVIDAFRGPFLLSGENLVIGVSIGIVLYPEDEQNEQALLRKADIAMYHAKSAGGNRYQFYSESLNRNALRQLEVESLIREALKSDYFEVYFQPKIHLRTERLAGMEALVRLNHPQHGLISPSEFIPLAEDTGLIVEIGDVVLKKACFAAQKWREAGLFSGRIAVNLSSRQFALPDLQSRIESILRLTKLPANNLELEITEGTVIKQPEKAIKVMQQLARMGINLALDDFGTGYSSLSYLKRFPIHTLKIDKAFIDDIDKSDRDLKMVDSIITIAHNMGLSVVGEGVEQTTQLNILRALDCEEIQGFIYSKAISEADFTQYLTQHAMKTSPDTTIKER
ncbi:EAL domain-containing protein [Shewanella sp. YIC-542]|uniref:EAL domain-containing protein n=1 Tax=Shewanella mytili TaxID=3377111 RepID=UPI00398F09B1